MFYSMSNRRGESTSCEFTKFIAKAPTRRRRVTEKWLQATTSDTLQHNGVAGLLSLWLLECVRAMLDGAEWVGVIITPTSPLWPGFKALAYSIVSPAKPTC
jgi:hypothetical protein